jgi:flagellar biosynthesis/type III secretory pathway M-ring protein FliF/YscJ
MEYLRRTIAQVAQQLEVLNRSQRIAIALCATLVAGSLFWLVQYSVEPEMVPLMSENFQWTELEDAVSALKAENISIKQIGSQIYIRPDDRSRAMMALAQADALPEDISVGFAELMADNDPFRPSDENIWRRQRALDVELARMIASSSAVTSARVITQAKSRRRVGAMSNIAPTASVYVKMAHGQTLNRSMVDGFARLVASAIPGLSPHRVTVMDAATNLAASPPDPEDAMGAGLLEEKKQNERHIADKLATALQSIPNVLISVSVELDVQHTKSTSQIWDKPQPKSESSNTSSNRDISQPAETGVNPNVGLAVGGGGAGTSNESEESKTEFYDVKATKIENTVKVPFDVTRAMAAISIPRSFLAGVYQARFGKIEDPSKLDDEEGFQKLRQEEIERVRLTAMKILMTASKDDVDVDVYYDLAEDTPTLRTFPGDGMAVASTDAGLGGYAKQYGTQAGLMVLALISFVMMSRMTRQSAAAARAKLDRGMPLDTEEDLHIVNGPVGKADISDGILFGQELDEETLRIGQLSEQISEMVESDPETTAELIRRWAESEN